MDFGLARRVNPLPGQTPLRTVPPLARARWPHGSNTGGALEAHGIPAPFCPAHDLRIASGR